LEVDSESKTDKFIYLFYQEHNLVNYLQVYISHLSVKLYDRISITLTFKHLTNLHDTIILYNITTISCFVVY